nr:response regulator transcription factor [uncultured Clostridium sp.]
MAKGKILVVDDEEHILELIRYNLDAAGYDVIEASDGDDAVKNAINEVPDLILLDLMLPGKDGYDVCRELRSNGKTKSVPIIMLTAKSEEIDKILGLELGADDYITKPFSVRELMARVKAVLRRYTKSDESSEKFVFGDIEADFENHSVICAGEKIELTLKEFELLEVLVKNRGKILTREMLLDKIWGYEYIGESRTVDVHIRYLRKKVEKDDKNPKFIETIRGVGYRFNPNV